MKQELRLLEDYNDKLSEIYDKEITNPDHFWYVPPKVKEFLSPYIKSNCKVLDIGIGTGKTAEYFSEKKCVITGVDISQKMLDAAKSQHPDWELFKADIQSGFDFLEGQKFDIIIAAGIFEFVENIETVLEHLYSLSNTSGKICFTYEEYIPDSRLQQWKISELGKGITDPIPGNLSFLVYRRTAEEVENILTPIFQILKSERIIAYYKTPDKIPVQYNILLIQKNA
ncbi:MAG: class I SAM-dependent methyltransferase [Candidatus Colwellbacteria bacterium]|nr:class I SAM-dependent methyltransferase [Candidatus Colwellbacteria bacterium]